MSVVPWSAPALLGRFLPAGRSPADGQVAARIRCVWDDFRGRSDRHLAEVGRWLRGAVEGGVSPRAEQVLLPAFALAAEALRRTIGIELFDVQLRAGQVLARGAIAEMATGEGKTLAAVAPAFLHALGGQGVHVMTVNAYLAERDWRLLAPAYEWLGITAGLLRAEDPTDRKRAAYQCQVTYGPGCEFGFDYLRDQSALLRRGDRRPGESLRELLGGEDAQVPRTVQRGHAFALVDEADSVLIDEAITPLVLAEGGAQPAPDAPAHRLAGLVAGSLEPDRDFRLDRARGSATLLPPGDLKAMAAFDASPASGLRRAWRRYVEQALAARRLLRRDVHYVVRDGAVVLVDESTGRLFADRTWQDGLHQAVEAKEGLPISREHVPLARIARQRYFRLYRGLSGMTGTARTSAWEFLAGYKLPVVCIPPRRPCLRRACAPRWFASSEAKWAAVAAEVAACFAAGRPVLVGTRNIANSETLAGRLDRAGIPYQLLNGKQDAAEAEIVARAGELGVVTIATNMAGRGTDIVPGPGVRELGGLHVLVSEPHDSPRTDRQLIGRSARQGDPGSYRVYVSADDRLLADHAPALARRLRRKAGADGEVTGHFTPQVARAQRRAERQHYRQRRQCLVYDDWREETLQRLEGPGK